MKYLINELINKSINLWPAYSTFVFTNEYPVQTDSPTGLKVASVQREQLGNARQRCKDTSEISACLGRQTESSSVEWPWQVDGCMLVPTHKTQAHTCILSESWNCTPAAASETPSWWTHRFEYHMCHTKAGQSRPRSGFKLVGALSSVAEKYRSNIVWLNFTPRILNFQAYTLCK